MRKIVMPGAPELLTPSEVAALFKVAPKTVTRWADEGLLSTVKTLGGHSRFFREQVEALLDGSLEARAPD
jgi:excisionase family DNA binding protein